MKPIGPLMWEHRLIEQIVPLMKKELVAIRDSSRVDIDFIGKAVDFFRTYADRTHHGKEEDILFRELEQKPLSADLKRIMQELMDEHVVARDSVRALIDSSKDLGAGDRDALEDLVTHLGKLVNLYPRHIEKEDKAFFFPVMEYFTSEEQERMLEEFHEFDRRMIHEKYQNLIEQMGGKAVRWRH